MKRIAITFLIALGIIVAAVIQTAINHRAQYSRAPRNASKISGQIHRIETRAAALRSEPDERIEQLRR
jgi:hypothetical protein